jgi:hypothetical protein
MGASVGASLNALVGGSNQNQSSSSQLPKGKESSLSSFQEQEVDGGDPPSLSFQEQEVDGGDPPSLSFQEHEQEQQQEMSGGNAAQHAIAVYGNAGQQHAASEQSNVIAAQQHGGDANIHPAILPAALTIASKIVHDSLAPRGYVASLKKYSRRRSGSRGKFGGKKPKCKKSKRRK